MKQVGDRIAQFLNFAFSIQVQVMKLEFIKDDQGVMWLSFISNIHVKYPEEKEENEIMMKTAHLLPEDARQTFLKSLEDSQPVDIQTSYQKKILDKMSTYYEEMKKVVGIDQCFIEKAHDNSSNEVFSKLRPLVPYSLEELLQPEMQYEANKWLKTQKPKRKLSTNYLNNI